MRVLEKEGKSTWNKLEKGVESGVRVPRKKGRSKSQKKELTYQDRTRGRGGGDHINYTRCIYSKSGKGGVNNMEKDEVTEPV